PRCSDYSMAVPCQAALQHLAVALVVVHHQNQASFGMALNRTGLAAAVRCRSVLCCGRNGIVRQNRAQIGDRKADALEVLLSLLRFAASCRASRASLACSVSACIVLIHACSGALSGEVRAPRSTRLLSSGAMPKASLN